MSRAQLGLVGRRSLQLLIVANFLLCTLPALAGRCEDLATPRSMHTIITKAEVVTGGSFTPYDGQPLAGLPDFCRVTASIKPTADSDIQIEVWMPTSGWNGRLEGTGNGGFAGKINHKPLAAGLRLGYAVANTDMGMATPPGADASIFVDRPERWADWGYRATHAMTVLAKQLVRTYYARGARRAYFVGCSTGGQQALMEAQRFPDDYDGIVGGAAANNRTGVHISILWSFAAPRKTPESGLPAAKIAMLAAAVVHRCDLLDGVKDGLIADPQECDFDPASLQCSGEDREDCLTRSQVKTVTELYAGPLNPRTGQRLYPGLPKGSEFGWDQSGSTPGATEEAPYHPIFDWVFGLKWDWRHFDYDHQVTALDNKLAGTLNATSADLDTFRSHGHKLLIYHGWSDSLVVPGETINYYNAVLARDKHRRFRGRHSGSLDEPLDNSVRLFMVPGMGHCGGGPGPTDFDPLGAVVEWVEDGIAPDRIIASQEKADGQSAAAMLQRPLCPYPRIARYQGSGNLNDASSYLCTDASSTPRKATLK